MLELRPEWCLDDEWANRSLIATHWMDTHGVPIVELDGDSWAPGQEVVLRRSFALSSTCVDKGEGLAVAARWSCRDAGVAGVHRGGPAPLPLATTTEIVVTLPGALASSVELETFILTAESHGSTLVSGLAAWSDAWSTPSRDRTLLLEGDEMRVPVRAVDFRREFDGAAGSLWSVDVDPGATLSDLAANVLTVLLDIDSLKRDFSDESGGWDAALVPASVISGIKFDVAVLALEAVSEELNDLGAEDHAPGTLGALLIPALSDAFGSVDLALADRHDDAPSFVRKLRGHFAPNSWKA